MVFVAAPAFAQLPGAFPGLGLVLPIVVHGMSYWALEPECETLMLVVWAPTYRPPTWRFLRTGAPSLGRPCNKIPALWGLYQGPDFWNLSLGGTRVVANLLISKITMVVTIGVLTSPLVATQRVFLWAVMEVPGVSLVCIRVQIRGPH